MRKLRTEELNRLSVEAFKKSDKTPVVVVLDNIRSFNNVGSAFRTSDAFRLEGIFLCGITARPPHREIHKTALGATESVDWKYFEKTEDAVDLLRKEEYDVIGVEQVDESIPLQDFKPGKDKKYALIFGNEVSGINDQVIAMCDKCVEIPQIGTKHSLNVSVSIGIVVWHFFKGIGIEK
jgi:tRNA G18 (ribose-2'-O)-methylase SpoU